jgi:hypothetical protein
MWVTFSRSDSSDYHEEFHEGCYQNHMPSRLDIFGYPSDFHEGHGTVGEWQGRGMACVN